MYNYAFSSVILNLLIFFNMKDFDGENDEDLHKKVEYCVND
jgi:hypothetical protein